MPETTPETARLTADVVLFGIDDDRQSHVLLIRRAWDPFAGCWALPGGHIDEGENTADAAARELREETGLTAPQLTPVAVYAEPGRDPRGRYATFAYTARIPHLPTPRADDDAAEARWVPLTEALTGLRLAFDHGRIIRDALRITD